MKMSRYTCKDCESWGHDRTILLSDIFYDPLSALQPNAHFPRHAAAYFDVHRIHIAVSFATN